MDKVEEKCATCKFFKKEHVKQGVCRAKPPVPILYGMQQPAMHGLPPQAVVLAHFPVVEDIQWCGSWQLKGAS